VDLHVFETREQPFKDLGKLVMSRIPTNVDHTKFVATKHEVVPAKAQGASSIVIVIPRQKVCGDRLEVPLRSRKHEQGTSIECEVYLLPQLSGGVHA
jgi:hypothetical protein